MVSALVVEVPCVALGEATDPWMLFELPLLLVGTKKLGVLNDDDQILE